MIQGGKTIISSKALAVFEEQSFCWIQVGPNKISWPINFFSFSRVFLYFILECAKLQIWRRKNTPEKLKNCIGQLITFKFKFITGPGTQKEGIKTWSSNRA